MEKASKKLNISPKDVARIRTILDKYRLKGDFESKIRHIERFGIRAKGGKINKTKGGKINKKKK